MKTKDEATNYDDLVKFLKEEAQFQKMDLQEYKKKYAAFLKIIQAANTSLSKKDQFPDIYPIHSEDAPDDCLSRLDIFQTHSTYRWLDSLSKAKFDKEAKQGYLDKNKDIN